MTEYNFPANTRTITGSYDEYLKFVADTYFPICQGQRVLEIGPFFGDHSKLIVDHAPRYFEVVEGYRNAAKQLKNIPGINQVTCNDIVHELSNYSKTFDVCICLGVMYHLHSPLHLLELIVNKCQPNYIILDSTNLSTLQPTYADEVDNEMGNRQTIKKWKSCQLNICVPFHLFNQSLYRMGYQLLLVDQIAVLSQSKSNSWMAMWKLAK
jgi:SAM-dependent methyltransferase